MFQMILNLACLLNQTQKTHLDKAPMVIFAAQAKRKNNCHSMARCLDSGLYLGNNSGV